MEQTNDSLYLFSSRFKRNWSGQLTFGIMDSKQFGRRLFFVSLGYPFVSCTLRENSIQDIPTNPEGKNPDSPDAWEVRITSRPRAFISGGRQLELSLWGAKSILLFIRLLWSGLALGISLPTGKWSWIIYTYHSIVNEYWRSLAKEGYEYAKALWIQIKNSWLSKSSICW